MWTHAPIDQILATNHNIVLLIQHHPTVYFNEKRMLYVVCMLLSNNSPAMHSIKTTVPFTE